MEIWLRRVYDRTEKGPEERVLVDRLWPRGVKKEAIPTWAKQIAPSRELHDWYKDHDEDFQGFRERYEKELSLNPAVPPFLEFLEEASRKDLSSFSTLRKAEKKTMPLSSGTMCSVPYERRTDMCDEDMIYDCPARWIVPATGTVSAASITIENWVGPLLPACRKCSRNTKPKKPLKNKEAALKGRRKHKSLLIDGLFLRFNCK